MLQVCEQVIRCLPSSRKENKPQIEKVSDPFIPITALTFPSGSQNSTCHSTIDKTLRHPTNFLEVDPKIPNRKINRILRDCAS